MNNPCKCNGTGFTASLSQKNAIAHLNGPAEIIAGPGSGKTFTIIQRILSLISNFNINPQQILTVTFSKRAAKEMQSRYKAMNGPDGVCFGTFHSVGYNILKESFGFKDNNLIIESDKRKYISNLLQNEGLKELDNFDVINDILNIISKSKNDLVSFDKKYYLYGKCYNLEIIINKYNRIILEHGKIDYDDMILLALSNLKNDHNILSMYQQRYKYILIDEFQDINSSQYELIKLIASPCNNLFVVGDDDQSIYGFRGANPLIMKKFLADFSDVNQIFLTENYRSVKNIVDLSSNIIEANKNRFCKKLRSNKPSGNVIFNEVNSRKQEENYIISILKNFKATEYNDIAILVRTNVEASLFNNLLSQSEIPLYGTKIKNPDDIFNSFIFEDITSFLKFIYEGKKRTDFIKFMNKPNRFIELDSLINDKINYIDIYVYYRNNEKMKYEIKKLFEKLDLASKLSTELAISLFIKSVGYDQYLKEKSKNKITYLSYIKVVEKITDFYKGYVNKSNIDNYILTNKDELCPEPSNNISNGIHILTMHASKGLEFDTVILPDLNDGVIPSKRCIDIEEERRLLYVAVTRAKTNLYLISNTERNRKCSILLKDKV